MSGEFSYQRIKCKDVTSDIVDDCKKLFLGHYGVWSSNAKFVAGKPIKAPAKWLENYLPIEQASLSLARCDEALIGYATAVQINTSYGIVTWVTQLVVHKDYRNQLVGSKLLNSIWGYSTHYAWGIASANPFAVRALEKVTRRLCDTKVMINRKRTISRIVNKIPYLKGKTVYLEIKKSVIDSLFFQDISGVRSMIQDASGKNPWTMGCINEGEEWLAITFKIQSPRAWSSVEFDEFQKLSDDLVRSAYERMADADPATNHAWAQKAYEEVDFIVQHLGLVPPLDVIDFGCGSGRHANEFKKLGFDVFGVDLSQKNILKAKRDYPNICFMQADIRKVILDKQFDIGVCLYDVVGSYADDQSNEQMLANLTRHIKPGGWVIVSLMSYKYSSMKSGRRVSQDIYQDLASLPATKAMQHTGEVFGPGVLLDEKSKIGYRKETFDLSDSLPEEFVVRDRRYVMEELGSIFSRSGLAICKKGYVSAGNFNRVLMNDPPNKEILIIAKKNLL
jgi:2-polyprenyl-3-methyl-5-hydroxy-6-metoxy-1,4-benzoquinol methylase/GNAT superfamily N-acetyltransferase